MPDHVLGIQVQELAKEQTPTTPGSSPGPASSTGSIVGGAYGDPPKDNGLASQKEYFEKNLPRRKLFVGIAEWFREAVGAVKVKYFGGELPTEGESGNRFSAFNRMNLPGEQKEVYLGMIPDNDLHSRIPKGVHAVSIVQNFEADKMQDSMHDKKTVVNAEDNVGMEPKEIEAGVEALKNAIDAKDNQAIYLHCKSGVGRSATVLAAYLMKYKNMTLDEAIETVQRDRPDAQLRNSWLNPKRWFGFKDTKHTEALRNYEQARATATAKLLGEGALSSDETKLLNQLIFENPELHSALYNLVTNVNLENRGKLIYDFNQKLPSEATSDDNVPKLVAKLIPLFSDRLGPVFAFDTDTLNDLSIGDPTLILDRHMKRKTAFYEGKDPKKPFWEIGEGPGALERHAGWTERSVPAQGKNAPVQLTRTLGLRDGQRERNGSVELNLPELTFDEAKQVMAALQKKAQNPKSIFGEGLPEELKAKVLTPCEDFLRNCQDKLSKMQGELVGFAGTPENIAQLVRNVDVDEAKKTS